MALLVLVLVLVVSRWGWRRRRAAARRAQDPGSSLPLRMALERIDGGSVEIHGESLWTRPGRKSSRAAEERYLRRIRSRVGMVFQHFNLFPHMSVLRNVTEALAHVQGLERGSLGFPVALCAC